MSASRCVYVIYLLPPLPGVVALPGIVSPSGLLNGHQACLAICKPSQLNCVCNSTLLAPGALPARLSKLPTCMHWLNLPKDTHTQLPNAVSVSQSVSLCPSWLPTQLNSASATASASASTIYLCISLAGRTHRRLQGLDVACEICAATWQRHLRVPSEYGAKDFDGIPLECHRWVQLQTCNLLERILHLASLPPLACALSATCRMHDLQLATCNLPRAGGRGWNWQLFALPGRVL